MILLALLLTPFCSVFGRAGGMSQDSSALPTWIPLWLRKRWVRDWLCPVCALLPLILVHPSWWFIFTYGLTGLFLTTYWDEVFKYDNFWFSGFMVGIAGFTLVSIFPWWSILIRALALAIGWGLINLWSNKTHQKDGVEELTRYGFFCLTTLIIL